MHKTHQSHIGDAPGQTDSSHKLERLKLPSDLSGKSVLDIGCNEGFFCNAVLQRDAKKVVGIDIDEKFLSEARERYADERLTFIKQGWQTLPDGPFDLILWTSAMHYELDPAQILPNICSKLSPDGLFVLECGLLQAPRKEMIYNIRHDGGLWYPTLPFLENALSNAGLTYRMVSQAEFVGTDPVPRVVFHCSVRQPTVLLVRGPTKSGKTNLAETLKDSATKVISLDHFVSRIAAAKFSHNDLQNLIKKNVAKNDLSKIYNGIDQAGLTDAYASLVTTGIARSDKLVLIEGYMTDLQAQAFEKCLKHRARVWEVGLISTRDTPPPAYRANTVASDASVKLKESVDIVGKPWKSSPYYSNAEKLTNIFWSANTPFQRLFNKLDLSVSLELACGHGRHAERAALLCGRLILMDIHDTNIDACRARLSHFNNVEFHCGNGYDFRPIGTDELTSIYCYDSMVHFSADLVQSYLEDTKRVLKPGGMALFHHSNYDGPRKKHYGQNPGARNHMTKQLFAKLSKDSELDVVEQVIFPWGGVDALDCISLVQKR